jgi:hypothetical protein
MKKLMSMLLGLSLVIGAGSLVFAQDKDGKDAPKDGKKKGKKKKEDDGKRTVTTAVR